MLNAKLNWTATWTCQSTT